MSIDKNAIKLIVTDIDGTLGPVSTDRINEEYYEVIKDRLAKLGGG